MTSSYLQSLNHSNKRNVQKAISVVFGIIGFIFFMRGSVPVAAILAVISFLSWQGGLWGYVAKKTKLSSNIEREEALDILGLKDFPTVDEINSSYKRLMQKNHPDQGGTEYFAIKLNQAKELLLEDVQKD